MPVNTPDSKILTSARPSSRLQRSRNAAQDAGIEVPPQVISKIKFEEAGFRLAETQTAALWRTVEKGHISIGLPPRGKVSIAW